MKTYQGSINFDGTREVRVISGGTSSLLLIQGRNRQHSYEWGDDCTNLAYDILYDAVGDKARAVYDVFSMKVIARLDGEEPFSLDWYDINQFVDDNTSPEGSAP